MKIHFTTAVFGLVLATSQMAQADEPLQAVTDIPSVASIMGALLSDVPHDIVSLTQTGDDVHHMSLRPSQARKVSDADIITWIGPDLSPWMPEVIEGLAPDAVHLQLVEGEGHHEGHDDHDEGHDEEHDDGHDEEHEDEHDHGHEEKHEEDHHDEVDAHYWLDLHNAEQWADMIAHELSELYPNHSNTIANNLSGFLKKVESKEAQVKASMASLDNTTIVVLHDAYRKFSDGFGITTLSAGNSHSENGLSVKEARTLRAHILDQDQGCFIVPVGTSAKTIATLTQGADINVKEIDIIGTRTDADAYLDLIGLLATEIVDCLS